MERRARLSLSSGRSSGSRRQCSMKTKASAGCSRVRVGWRPTTLALACALGFASLLGSGGGGGGGGSGEETSAPVDETSIASWRTRDAKPLMSIVSVGATNAAWPFDPRLWRSSTRVVGVLPMVGVVRLPNGREGLVMGAWGNSAEAADAVPPMRLVIFEQGADGLMREATAAFVDDDMTDGSGLIKVVDFNGDGRDDFVLPMYTETPTTTTPPVPMPRSVAFVSRPDGRYDRIDMNSDLNGPLVDAAPVAGAWQLFTPNGGPSLESGAFSWAGTFTWRWNGSGFTKVPMGGAGDPAAQASASSVIVRPFTGNGELWMVRTDNDLGPGVPDGSNFDKVTRAWRVDANNQYVVPPVTLPAPYFNGKPEYQPFESWLDPKSKTHNATIWSTDLNQDGLPDLVAGAQLWGSTRGLQKAMLQLLVNKGGMTFEDQTDTLRPEFRIDGEIDMSARPVDLDGSGIDTLVMGQGRWGIDGGAMPRTRHGSYLLVNDGTGRLYAAMDAEFAALGQQVLDFVSRQAGLSVDSRTQPNFFAYRRADGKLNFLAQMTAMRTGTIDPGSQLFAFVNVPLGIDITTGFKRDLTVATRNGSRNIRTFAGNDTIFRALADPDCRIDGGGGTNTVVYPGRRADWVLTRGSDGVVSVTPVAGGGTDRLTRIQRARFDDLTLELSAI